VTLPIWTTNPYTPLSLGNIQTEFDGQDPINFSEYYKSPSGYVTPDRKGYPGGVEVAIPSAGDPISISNFYGASAVPYSITTDKTVYNEGDVVYFTITAPEPNGNVLYWTIEDATVSVTVNPSTLPNGLQRVPYSQTITASGGIGSYTYRVSHGALPGGLSIGSGSGVISGSPTSVGSSAFIIEATDSAFNSGVRSYSVAITAVTITLSPSTLTAAFKNANYTNSVSASGGQGPYTFAVTSGTLPTGISLNSSGAISGRATTPSSNNITITATDANGNTGFRAYTFTVSDVVISLSPATLPSGLQNVAYTTTVSASGGQAAYQYAITSGTLPAGLSLNTTNGLISGTPTAVVNSTITITATDANTNTGSKEYTLSIGLVTITLDPTSLPGASRNIAYSQQITASGGTSPYAYSLFSGSLPAGLSISGTGLITGSPSATGTSSFVVKAIDANSNSGSRSYTIVVAAVTITLSPPTLPNAPTNTSYTQTITASGGTSPYTFTVTSGSLPTGLTLSSSGVISGTPTVAGSSSFTVTAADANTNTGTRAYTIVVSSVTITLSPSTLPGKAINVYAHAVIGGTVGTPLISALVDNSYTQTITASGGTSPYTFTVTSGSLPTGLTLSSSGVITGTLTTTGSSNFTVTATDANTNIGTRAYSIAVT